MGLLILEAHQGVDSSYRFQTVLLEVGYVIDNVDPLWKSEKCRMFLTILAETRMVIWMTRKKELYDGTNFSHCDLILFFRHQVMVKIRCDRKYLYCITFNKRWMHTTCLIIRRRAMLSFSPLFCTWQEWSGILRTPPQ